MSNWFIYQKINRYSPFNRTRKGLISNFLIVSAMAAAGVWLIFSLLSQQGLYPFVSNVPPINAGLLNSFSPSVRYWEAEIQSWANEWQMDPVLIATVMQIESCGDPHAISAADAQGLFQVMPYHFLPGENMLDPQTNASRGLAYLHNSFIKSGGDIYLTLAGYNGGHGQINRPDETWPDETQRYALWGSGIYHEILVGNRNSLTLEAWLEAGGKHLCQNAEENLSLQ